MTSFLLHITHFDTAGKRSSVQRRVDRDWPSVPQIDQLVSLGGGDLVLEPLVDAEYRDGHVRLSFLIKEDDGGPSLKVLGDLGFEAPKAPEGNPGIS